MDGMALGGISFLQGYVYVAKSPLKSWNSISFRRASLQSSMVTVLPKKAENRSAGRRPHKLEAMGSF